MKPRHYLLIGGILAAAGIAVWIWARFLRPPHGSALAGQHLTRTTNILMIGTDGPDTSGETAGLARTDVLILASCELDRNRLALLSIPRDTLVDLPGHGTDRINMASILGGIPLTRRMVEELTGLKIDRYMMVDFRGFEELVDLLGGVEVDVDKRMYYQDRSQDLLIDLQKGRQKLNGRQALGYVRYRRDSMGDIARVQRQQALIRAVWDKMRAAGLWTKVIPLFRLKGKYVKTDLRLADLYCLRNFVSALSDPGRIVSFTVPGWFSGPYWGADAGALAALIRKEFNPSAPPPKVPEPKALDPPGKSSTAPPDAAPESGSEEVRAQVVP